MRNKLSQITRSLMRPFYFLAFTFNRDYDRADIAATIRGGGGNNAGSCSESCEAFIVGNADTAQMDLFARQENAA
ncbi:hypothetical protein B9P82_27325 [Citrobacter sp. L55]|nr:hypothetical protein B9P82_27325 [Citrobacter sp. L55]